VVGEIRKAHGIKGECFVMPATDDVAGVYAKGHALRLGDPQGAPFEPAFDLTVLSARPFKGGLIVRFDELVDRNAAEAVRGRTLLIHFQDARPLAEGEFFLHDLVDLEVLTADGERIGSVKEIYEVGTGYFLGVDDGGRERLIPFSQRIVREIDLAGGRLVIDPPPGMLDL
jgi:16S rRNA processing protein RimM